MHCTNFILAISLICQKIFCCTGLSYCTGQIPWPTHPLPCPSCLRIWANRSLLQVLTPFQMNTHVTCYIYNYTCISKDNFFRNAINYNVYSDEGYLCVIIMIDFERLAFQFQFVNFRDSTWKRRSNIFLMLLEKQDKGF